ncbi:MAG: glutaredoxin 3 [Alphaproteobacteria bacterium]|nr:glutaredoxin 3 [Alphaproteobacteria bacterium]
MLSCRDLARRADRYVDGELPLRERLEVRLHMFLCKHCSRYVEQLRLTIEALRHSVGARQSPEPQEEAVDGLLSAMRSEQCRHTPVYEDTISRVLSAVRESGAATGDTAAPAVVVYTTPWCPYCRRAKALLHRKNMPYREVNIAGDPVRRQEMTALAAGRTTVPQIFIGGHGIGGCDELYALDSTGELDRLLGRA